MLFLPMNSNDTLAIDACKPEVLKKMLLPKFWAACAWDMFQTGRFVKTHVFHTYTALSEFYLRLHPVNFTWGCIQWTLLETASFLNFTCGCILFLGTAPSELYLGLFPFWALLETASSELYLSLLETASSELYFRLHPVNLTWDCIHWTLPGSSSSELYLSIPEAASSELYFRLHPVNLTWDCIHWTLPGSASSELYFRLHPVNFTWGCIQWTLLEAASSELYLRLLVPFWALPETASSELYLTLRPVNLASGCRQWTLPETAPSELYPGLHPVNLTWSLLHTFFKIFLTNIFFF